MLPTCYAAPGETSSPRFARAFAAGCGGADVVADTELRPGPVALFGSPFNWDLLRQARAEGRPWYYGDHAYFGRWIFYRITRNGFQLGAPGAWLPPEPDYARLRRLDVTMEPWRDDGEYVLICPPDAAYAARQGFCERLWLDNVKAMLREHTDRRLKVRRRETAEDNPVTLREELENAFALVTHHSNAAVEAICAGVPVFTTGYCAAREMAETDLTAIEDPFYPDNRTEWAARLAAAQWTLEEIAAGDAWRAMKEWERE